MRRGGALCAGNNGPFAPAGSHTPVAGSPFRLTVYPAAVHPPATQLAGLIATITAGDIALVTITTFDRFGNPAITLDIVGALEAIASRPDGAAPDRKYRISVQADGTITVPIGPLPLAGVWSYEVFWDGVSIMAAAQQVVVNPGPLDTVVSTAEGYAVGAAFGEGENAPDTTVVPVYANSNSQVCGAAILEVPCVRSVRCSTAFCVAAGAGTM